MKQHPHRELELLVADVYELAGALRRRGEGLAADAGQTQARWQLLSVVAEGEWTVPRASERLGVSRQAVQRVADDLEAEGLVRYAPNPRHRRSMLVEPTSAGRDALATITAGADRWHSTIASDLDPRSIEQTRLVLRRILERIAQSD